MRRNDKSSGVQILPDNMGKKGRCTKESIDVVLGSQLEEW